MWGMAQTPPTRKGREPKPGTLFPSQVLAENLPRLRGARALTQGDLAERMAALGHGWVRQTVGEVERSGRAVNADELIGLALSLKTSIAGLLDPDMSHGPAAPTIDIGAEFTPRFEDLIDVIAQGARRPYGGFGWPNLQVAWDGNAIDHVLSGRMTVTPADPDDNDEED